MVTDSAVRGGRRLALLHAELKATSRQGDLVLGDAASQPAAVSLPRIARRVWKRKRLEPIGLHEARHTFASFLIAAGVGPAISVIR